MPTLYQPGQKIDHYKIVESLGQGGSSHVYLAQDQQNDQQVVLKFPNVEEIGSMDVFARYQREMKIGKHLSHPLIQHHLNLNETRSAEYLVLEYLRGHNLREAMKKQAPELFPLDEVIRIMRQVAEILVSVHEQGVIHRDMKPENILLLECGDVAVFDFGISQWKGERLLRWRGFSTPIGTPCYMSPELLQARAGSVQSDIYAVGAVLYELLCGRTPFEEHNDFNFITEHISHDPPDILTFNPTLSPALATVVMRALRRDPRKRYASMQALLNDLAHLDNVTVESYQPDPPLIGGRYRQVFRVVFIILIVCLFVFAFGVLAQFAHPVSR